MRLNKYLAHATGISRREADGIISAGRVFINGTKASLGAQVEGTDRVEVDHGVVTAASQHTCVLLNKPVGYLCSRRSQGGVPTIFTLLPAEYQVLKPVGRLDKDSSGLILLTSDGDFAHRMTHPSFHKVKVYEVELDKPLQPLHQQMISDYGITLEDGVSKFLIERQGASGPSAPAVKHLQPKFVEAPGPSPEPGAKPLNSSAREESESYRITMHEGRNRQIRRTFAALGYTVTKLHRISFGNYSLGDIKTGEYTLVDIS